MTSIFKGGPLISLTSADLVFLSLFSYLRLLLLGAWFRFCWSKQGQGH